MNLFSIDRFEGELAVLIDDEGRTVTISRVALPSGAAEGDVLSRGSGGFCLEKEETARRKAAARAAAAKLFGGGAK